MFRMDEMSANAGVGPDLFVPRASLAIFVEFCRDKKDWLQSLCHFLASSMALSVGRICLSLDNYSDAVPES